PTTLKRTYQCGVFTLDFTPISHISEDLHTCEVGIQKPVKES
ncbi:hypothetical protein AVEN_183029-1, partial [Araneus ventricosus]